VIVSLIYVKSHITVNVSVTPVSNCHVCGHVSNGWNVSDIIAACVIATRQKHLI